MKKALFCFLFILMAGALPYIITAQDVDRSQWITSIDSSAFDGISRTCGVFGKSNNETYNSPQFALSRKGNEDPMIYLTYWPYGGCEGNKLYVKFGNEQNIYEPRISFISNSDQYILFFWDSKAAARYPNIRITKAQFIQKLKTSQKLYMRLISTCISIDVEFTLENAKDMLELMQL